MTERRDDHLVARVRSAMNLRRRPGYGARTILILLALIAGIVLVMFTVRQDATRRRTASTPIQVESTRLQVGRNYDQSPTGTWIRYVYVVDGLNYRGYDFSRWLDVASNEPKVCFDPKNPAEHLLVRG